MSTWKIVLLALFAAAAAGAFALVHWLRPYNLKTEEKAAHAAGVPLTVADLKVPAVAPGENAAPVYQALAALRERRPLDIDAVDAATRKRTSLARIDTASAEAIRRLITGRPDVTRLVQAAAAKPHSRFPVDWSILGQAAYFARLSGIRECARWIRWESILLARDGRFEEAVANQALGFHIAGHAAEEPLLMGLMLRNACETVTLHGMRDILATAGPNASVAELVRRQIAAHPFADTMPRCLEGEMVLGLKTLGDTVPQREAGTALDGASRAVYIHWMTRLIQASRKPPRERISAMLSIQRNMGKLNGDHPAAVLASTEIPVFVRAAQQDSLAQARRILVSTMASVMSYRARTGRYPTSLAQAISPIPHDPYTGNPLGYQTHGNGFTLYAQPDVTREDPQSAAKLRRWNTISYP